MLSHTYKMILQTKIPLKKEQKNLIDYNSKILLLGSCFSENIGDKLNYYKFQTSVNPFGILFHPKAIENILSKTIQQKKFTEQDLIFKNERWHCFEVHSNLSNSNKNDLLENLNATITSTHKKLKETSHLVITLGTSWVYTFLETNKIVANCHKIPQKKFKKHLLSVDEIQQSLITILSLLKSINAKINVLFTVSPIRHLKDGFVENTRSKAHLISAIHNLNHQTNASYFPSYEIMMDELRDYRFYAEDMIHPNKTAINYIWKKFIQSWFSEDSVISMKEVETIQKGMAHRPFNENSVEHQKFLENLRNKISKIKQEIPFINFD